MPTDLDDIEVDPRFDHFALIVQTGPGAIGEGGQEGIGSDVIIAPDLDIAGGVDGDDGALDHHVRVAEGDVVIDVIPIGRNGIGDVSAGNGRLDVETPAECRAIRGTVVRAGDGVIRRTQRRAEFG